MSTKKLQILGSLGNNKIYTQNDEPTNAADGTLWVDLDAEGGADGGTSVLIDTTLTQSGWAADAKVVGDALASKQPIGNYVLKDDMDEYATVSDMDTIADSTVKYGDALLTTNPFGGKRLYISKIDNALYCANKRWNVSAIEYNNDGSVFFTSNNVNLFNGNYDGANYVVYKDKYAVINIDFGDECFPGYPYGYFYLSFYYGQLPQSVTARVYSNYEVIGVGWHNLSVANLFKDDNRQIIAIRNDCYKISQLEITITANSDNDVYVSQLELYLDRPAPDRMPIVSKYKEETLYYPLTAPYFNGDLNGTATNADTLDGKHASDFILATEQTLTDEQKAQVRVNIGAASVDDVLAALPTWEGGSY